MSDARVSVVIPTWNGFALLRAALESLRVQRYRNFEVIVVDNGSTDGTAEFVCAQFPEVQLVQLESNQGFAPAVNAGIQAANGEIIVLLNNDAEAEASWLSALVAALDKHPEVGACASKVLIYADPRRIDSAGDQFGLFASAIGHGELDDGRFGQPRFVLSASAGAAAYRRNALDDVGLFDERFFAYFEDVDLGIRLQLAGYRCLYVPGAVVLHHGSATAKRIAATKFFLLMRNALFVFFQYMPLRRVLIWGLPVLCWPFVRAAIDRQSPWVAARAVGAFVSDLGAVLRRRRKTLAGRRISNREYRNLLSSPLTRQSANRPLTAGTSAG